MNDVSNAKSAINADAYYHKSDFFGAKTELEFI